MSFNKITIIGNLGRDPELRYTPQGDAVCDFSVAVNDKRRDKAGELQDVTTWFKVTFWRRQAENASKYLTKGKQVYVEGRLQVEEWTDRDGNNRWTLVIQGTDMHFISDGRESGQAGAEHLSDNSFSNDSSADNFAENRSAAATTTDDDIPF